MGFNIKVDTKSLAKELNQTVEDIRKGAKQGANILASEIKNMEVELIHMTTGQQTYVPTGELARSVQLDVKIDTDDYIKIDIAPSVEYAPYVELGTGKFASDGNGRQDSWIIYLGQDENGKDIFRYTHGIPPHFFVRDTKEFFEPIAEEIVQDEIRKYLK